MVADWAELKASVREDQVIDRQMIYAGFGGALRVGAKLHKVVVCSESLKSDAALARQLKRKHL